MMTSKKEVEKLIERSNEDPNCLTEAEELQISEYYIGKESKKSKLKESIGTKREIMFLLEDVLVEMAKEVMPENPKVIELVRRHDEFMAYVAEKEEDEKG